MTNNFKLEIFIPTEHVDALREALAQVGAGRVGNYNQCCSMMNVRGCKLNNWKNFPDR
jgi:hypothetical protein